MDGKKPEINTELGAIRIADEVVATVAGLAASEVEGVATLSGGWGTDLVEKLGKKNFGKGIRVEVIGEETKIDIYAVIDYGYQIPKVAEEIQNEVKQAVENMTGLKVMAVNVHIVSVILKKSEPEEIASADVKTEY
ncbi:MAG: Asp23/Gls24 family envelope stress response protein [Syntrophomonadaceae bacterium]|jgi:uncharacterized alkaline shock family protein YloU|nr:Asp23/Gls24 family envelope stress response protein [Syntrophomonadaceae bacterium]